MIKNKIIYSNLINPLWHLHEEQYHTFSSHSTINIILCARFDHSRSESPELSHLKLYSRTTNGPLFSAIEQLLNLQPLFTLSVSKYVRMSVCPSDPRCHTLHRVHQSVCLSHPRCHTLNVNINHTKCQHYSQSAFSYHQLST